MLLKRMREFIVLKIVEEDALNKIKKQKDFEDQTAKNYLHCMNHQKTNH